ncbi:hypothetical protein BG011_005228 [Mortierella polycephala]|uniref:Uncharacterized protein n=1 Tax=Mortierella polycephala TaxID=41804 RepID=A0A9P6PWK4_9FUNG|nr:hypothetical protein BG011_005228 [Mortierella polycephala]
MPSSRFHARNRARAIPLVTVSLARGNLRQTQFANHMHSDSNDHNQELSNANEQQGHEAEHEHRPDHEQGDRPPPYEAALQESNSHSHHSHCLVTTSPSNADLSEAALHLSRTLVSATKHTPQPPPKTSWVFMMIYNWTHTHRAATRLYHILTNPRMLFKEIQGHNEHLQNMMQRQSIQQLTEEQDRMDDDPDMLDDTATEMVPVSMMNIRSAANMEDSLPEDPESLEGHDDSSDDSASPRKLKRRIDHYPNPFGSNISSMDEQEDDEGWFGRGEECSENGETKTNSVRLSTPTQPHSIRRPIPDFATSSLGYAMNPGQFENTTDKQAGSRLSTLSTTSIFNTPTGARFNQPSFNSSPTAELTSRSAARLAITTSITSDKQTPSQLSEGEQKISLAQKNLETEPGPQQNSHYPTPIESPWEEQSRILADFRPPSTSDHSSPSNSTPDASSGFTSLIAINSLASADSISSSGETPSFSEAVS